MTGNSNIGILLIIIFGAAIAKGSMEEEQLLALAISGWSFFILLTLFVIAVAVREGVFICKDYHEGKTNAEEYGESKAQTSCSNQLEYESLEHDKSDQNVGIKYEDIQLQHDKENSEGQIIYENMNL